MHVARLRAHRHASSDRDDVGYAMAALIVALSVMAVVMAAAMPVWKQLAQREKEAELVFRGQQYVHAIALFQRRNGPGTLPPNVTVLLEQRFLRKKYKDPITNDDFQPLLAGQAAQGAPSPGRAGSSTRPGGAATATPTAGRGGAAANAATPAALPVGGVMGVVSKSPDQSIRVYNGRTHYNEWAFIFTAPTPAPGAPVGTPGVGQRQGVGAGAGRAGLPGSSAGFGSRGARGAPALPSPTPGRRGR